MTESCHTWSDPSNERPAPNSRSLKPTRHGPAPILLNYLNKPQMFWRRFEW